jgi:hypothetical protein
MSYYGWSLEQIEELTYDQIRLWHYLAAKNEADKLRAQAALMGLG